MNRFQILNPVFLKKITFSSPIGCFNPSWFYPIGGLVWSVWPSSPPFVHRFLSLTFRAPFLRSKGYSKRRMFLEDSCLSRLRFLLVSEYRFGSVILEERWQFCLFQRLAGTLAELLCLALESLPGLDKVSRFLAHQAFHA